MPHHPIRFPHTHSLYIREQIQQDDTSGISTLYHEFTHILDAEMYVKSDYTKQFTTLAYTEYHAAQLQFMQILGAQNVHSSLSFSMHDMITMHGKPILINDFVNAPLLLAIKEMNEQNFPKDLRHLMDILGLVFNYYGRRSLCIMYSTDYQDTLDTSSLIPLLSEDDVAYFNKLLIELLNENKIFFLEINFRQIIYNLMKQYQFI